MSLIELNCPQKWPIQCCLSNLSFIPFKPTSNKSKTDIYFSPFSYNFHNTPKFAVELYIPFDSAVRATKYLYSLCLILFQFFYLTAPTNPKMNKYLQLYIHLQILSGEYVEKIWLSMVGVLLDFLLRIEFISVIRSTEKKIVEILFFWITNNILTLS